MYQDILAKAGLSANEALIYEFMLKNGTLPAGEIIKKTPLKRGVVYNVLSSLEKRGLVQEQEQGKIARFAPTHPEKLREILQAKEQEAYQADKLLTASWSNLLSDFNLSSGKPGVRVLEGLEGIKIVNEDSLHAKEMIRTYADIEAVDKYIPEINRAYVRKREKLGIKKRVIALDSPYARKALANYHRQVTDVRLIDHQKFPFTSTMQIYDGKIAVSSLSGHCIGLIIEDRAIYEMQRSLFDFAWSQAETLPQPKGFSKTQ